MVIRMNLLGTVAHIFSGSRVAAFRLLGRFEWNFVIMGFPSDLSYGEAVKVQGRFLRRLIHG